MATVSLVVKKFGPHGLNQEELCESVVHEDDMTTRPSEP